MMEKRLIRDIWEDYKSEVSGKPAVTRHVTLTFAAVAIALVWLAKKLHLTYNEINVIAYYWLIPATWTAILDYKVSATVSLPFYEGFYPWLTISLCLIWVGIILATCLFFSKWCDVVFRASQSFLCIFNRWGGNYVLNSVVICVIIPIIIYILLLSI